VLTMKSQGWTDVRAAHPQPHKVYRVYSTATDQVFDATPCYGMHEPWWVPRNGYTRAESDPIPFTSTYWQEIVLPQTYDEGTRMRQ